MSVKQLCLVLLLSGVLSACHDKSVEPATEKETNDWILAQMKYWYYWNDKIPANPDFSLAPSPFFSSLLYKYDAASRPDGDRFSWIQQSAEELQAALSGERKTTGMEYKLVYYPKDTKTNVAGIVFFALPDSPAAKAGFKRGDVFTSINGEKLTGTNYSKLISTEGNLTYTMGKISEDGVIAADTLKREVGPVVFQENPIHFDTLLQYGANKVGYIVYHQFIPGPNGSESQQFDKELDQIFADFKASQVNSLVLDLRYNSGGYVSSATGLASLIGKVTPNDIFFYKEYNKTVTPVLQKKYGSDYFNDKFQAKVQNVGSQLNHLIVLTSATTASASELLINGLKPFMNVTIIGGKTRGKNVGSITLTGEKQGIKWGLQPIVTKSFNGLHQSDYSVGFAPDVAVSEGNRLYSYGNPKDPLLGEALFQILGSRVTRTSPSEAVRKENKLIEIESTIDRRAGGGNMFFDQ